MTIRRLGAMYALQGVTLGLMMPFLVPLLDERGLGAAEIGLILGIAGVASLLTYPVWGAIADGWLGRPRTIALTAITAALGGLGLLFAGSDPLTLTLALSLAMAGLMVWFPLLDALTLGELDAAGSGYGRIRVWASAGWAAAATAGGVTWLVAGPAPVFSAFVVLALLLAVLMWRASGAPAPTGEAAAEARPARSLRGWLPLFLTPVLLGFLVGLLVTSVGEHASWRFTGLRILDQGGGVLLVGLAAALPALIEIPVFAGSGRMAARIGLRWLFVSGAAVAAILMALVVVAPEPWMVTTLRTLEGASYALRYTAMVLIIGVLLPRHLFALGQTVAWFVYAGIAPIIGDAAGGIIYDELGAPALFAAATATLAIGGGIVWVALRGSRFGPRRTVPDLAELPAPPPPA